MKGDLCGDTIPGVTQAKVAPCYVKEFCNAGISREFAEAAVCARYKANGTDLTETLSLAEQRTIVRNLDTARPIDVLEGVDDGEDNWEFESMVNAEERATSSICRKL